MPTIIQRVVFKGRLFLEWVRGVDFLQSISLARLDLPSERAHHYSTSANKYLDRVLEALQIQPGDRVVDFGCGKGAALARMARFFEGVEGVELSAELVGIARRNMAKLRLNHVTIHHMDGAAFQDIDRFRFFYFYSPFPCNVMSEVLENIRLSLARVPREAVTIYRNPECHDVIVASGIFEKTAEYPTEQEFPFFIYRNVSGSVSPPTKRRS